jgi:mitogen-activated protein kinase 1/3
VFASHFVFQLHLIIDTLGTPSYEDTEYIASEKAKAYIRSLPYKKRVNWRAMYPNAPELALDLLEKMLTFAPEKRITVDEALAHPYLKLLHDPLDEPVAHAPFDVDFENIPLNKEALRALLWDETCQMHPEVSGTKSCNQISWHDPSAVGGKAQLFQFAHTVHPLHSVLSL